MTSRVPSTDVPAGQAGAGRWHAEDGEGLFSTLFGVLMFLLFLLFTVQVTTHLYATTVVTTAAYDAARLVSGAQVLGEQEATAVTAGSCPPPSATELERADDHLAELLGGLWEPDAADWTGTGTERVALRVSVTSPARIVSGAGALVGLGRIEREVALDRECFR